MFPVAQGGAPAASIMWRERALMMRCAILGALRARPPTLPSPSRRERRSVHALALRRRKRSRQGRPARETCAGGGEATDEIRRHSAGRADLRRLGAVPRLLPDNRIL